MMYLYKICVQICILFFNLLRWRKHVLVPSHHCLLTVAGITVLHLTGTNKGTLITAF